MSKITGAMVLAGLVGWSGEQAHADGETEIEMQARVLTACTIMLENTKRLRRMAEEIGCKNVVLTEAARAGEVSTVWGMHVLCGRAKLPPEWTARIDRRRHEGTLVPDAERVLTRTRGEARALIEAADQEERSGETVSRWETVGRGDTEQDRATSRYDTVESGMREVPCPSSLGVRFKECFMAD